MRLGSTIGLCALAALMAVTASAQTQSSPYAQKHDGNEVITLSVYFTHNSAEVESSGRALLKGLVDEYLNDGGSLVHLVGHDETARPADETMVMSQLRALAVANVLREMGVSADRISLEFLGEERLARFTRDGIREPLNRRVDVTILASKAE